jgi:GntR family transcriptional repressor for pyruvate dehydrogenase complex
MKPARHRPAARGRPRPPEAPSPPLPKQPRFGPVKTRRVFEEICAQIRKELATGKLSPGDKLPAERDLAQQFGVSRTAVREALRSLEIAGVIALQKGVKGGAFIQKGNSAAVTQSIRDMLSLGRVSLDNLTEARTLIQQVVIRLACERATEDDFAKLERIIDQTALADSFSDRLDASAQFYVAVAQATRNEVFVVVVDAMYDILRHFIADAGPTPKLELIDARRRFLKHFRARNAEAAAAELTAHLTKLHRHILKHRRRTEATRGAA